MPERDWWLEIFLKAGTFSVIIFLIVVCSWAANWHLGPTMVSLVLILCGYTIILVLPMKRFKLGPTGFEGELERLTRETPPAVSRKRTEEVDRQVATFSEETVEPDLLLMRLSIEIETTLRDISAKAGLEQTKVGIGQLIRFLQSTEKITDPWLIDALKFFQKHRNELVHEGKTTDIQKAIEIGRAVLARLKEIQ